MARWGPKAEVRFYFTWATREPVTVAFRGGEGGYGLLVRNWTGARLTLIFLQLSQAGRCALASRFRCFLYLEKSQDQHPGPAISGTCEDLFPRRQNRWARSALCAA